VPPHEVITSAQNPRLKLVRQLQDKKHRLSEQRFVVEYWRELERALHFGYQVDFVLYDPALLAHDEQAALEQVYCPKFVVTAELLEKVGYRQNPTGILGVLHIPDVIAPPPPPSDDNRPILALVALEKPGNIGALLRTADAAGVSAVFLVDTTLDRYNPNIIRASTGACFLPHVYEVTTPQALTFFQRHNYSIISAHLEGTTSLYQLDLTQRCAIVLGTEDKGLPDEWARSCDTLMKIPMVGDIADSLNVSVSGAIFLYEALRQRQYPSILSE
jgi:TrmH family RNA methyltransferase